MREITTGALAAYLIRQAELRDGNPYQKPSDTEERFEQYRKEIGRDLLVSRAIGMLSEESVGQRDLVAFMVLSEIAVIYGTMYQTTPLPADYRWKAAAPLELLAHYNLTGKDISHLYVNVCGNGKTGDINRFLKFLIALNEKVIPHESLFENPERKGYEMNYNYILTSEDWNKVNAYVEGKLFPRASSDTVELG